MNGEEKVYNLNRANMFLHYMTFSEREIFCFFVSLQGDFDSNFSMFF